MDAQLVETVAGAWSDGMTAVGLQVFILTGIALLFSWFLRHRDARLRHLLWLLVLVRLAIPFDLSTPVGLSPEIDEATLAGWTDWHARGFFEGRESVSAATAPIERVGQADDPAILGRPVAPELTASAPAAPREQPWPVSVWLLIAWFSGVMTFAAMALLRRRRHLRLLRLAQPAVRAQRLVDRLRARLGVRREVHVSSLPNDHVGGPALVGRHRPLILLPENLALAWPEEELEPVLVHELVHVMRRDPWICLFQNLLQAIYFFNPVVWWLNSRLQRERELCCDDAVVRFYEGARRPYVESLLRFGSEARQLRVGGLALGVADGGTVAGRVRRLLSRRYVAKRSSRLAIVTVLLGSAFAAILAGTATRFDGNELDRQRLSIMRTIDSYYLPGEDGLLDTDHPYPVGGDVTYGEQSCRLPAVELPPDVEGEARIRLLVGLEGEVLLAEMLEGVDKRIDDALVKSARALRFEPSTHKAFGPVGLETVYHVEIAPSVPRAPEVRPAVEREVVELSGVQRFGEPARRVPAGQFLEIVKRQKLAVTVDPRLAGDYSYVLSIDSSGEVIEVTLVAFPHEFRAPDFRDFSEQLEAWLSTFRFAPYVDDGKGVEGVGAVVDLRADADGVRVVTYLPPTDEWREELADLYSLEKSQSLKLLPAPLPKARLSLYRALDPLGSHMHQQGPAIMALHWTDNGLEGEPFNSCYGGCALFESSAYGAGFVLDLLGHEFRFQLELDPELEGFTLGSGDVLLRQDASLEELLDDFTAELERLTGIAVGWQQESQMRRTLVLHGRVGELEREPALANQPVLHLFQDVKDRDPSSGAGFFDVTDSEGLVAGLEVFLEIPVVDEAVGGVTESFLLRMHDSAQNTAFLDRVLSNIEDQTDLELSLEDRPTDVVRLFVRG